MAGKSEADLAFEEAEKAQEKSEADNLFDDAAAKQEAATAPVEPSSASVASEPSAFSPRSASGAALRGYAQGASFGFEDELQGLVGAGVRRLSQMGLGALKNPVGRRALRMYLGDKANGLPDAALDAMVDAAGDEAAEPVLGTVPRARGGAGLPGATYEKLRNEARFDNAVAEASHPKTYAGSGLAGALSVPGPKGAGMSVGGATLRPWVGRALTGAAVGGATGLGMSEGSDAGDVLKDAATGAGVGGVAAPLVGGAIDKLGSKAFARWLEQRSRQNALKAIGLTPGITDKARQLNYTNADDMMAFGARIRDEGDLIRPFSRPESTVPRIEGALDEAVGAKSAANDELEEMLKAQGREFDFNKLAQRADALRPAEGWDPLTRRNAAKALEMLGAASASKGGFGMAEQVRRAMGKSIPWKAPAFGQALPEEVALMRKGYGAMADEILQQARDTEARSILNSGRIPTPEDLGASNQLKAMNSRISLLMDAQQLASANATREVAKGGLSLKDLGVATMLGAPSTAVLGPVAGPIVGLAGAAVSSAAKGRLPSAMTYAQHGLASALPRLAPDAEVLAQRAGKTIDMKSVSGAGAPEASANAFEALRVRYGLAPKDADEAAGAAFTGGLMDSR